VDAIELPRLTSEKDACHRLIGPKLSTRETFLALANWTRNDFDDWLSGRTPETSTSPHSAGPGNGPLRYVPGEADCGASPQPQRGAILALDPFDETPHIAH